MAEKQQYLTYMGKPYVRSKNTIYYGDPAEKCIVELKVLDTVKVAGRDIANRVSVKLVSTDMTGYRPQVLKSSEKVGLYTAMDLGMVWLERELKA